jgi:hypothetical protein
MNIMTPATPAHAKQFATRLELHHDWKVVRGVIQHLCDAMEQLNSTDADDSLLQWSNLSSSKSAYGFASKALREVVLAQFGFDLSTVDVNWGGAGGGWANDVKEVLVQHLVA